MQVLGRLTLAIAAMPNLCTFRWYTARNAYMIPSEKLLNTLVLSCPQLHECTLP